MTSDANRIWAIAQLLANGTDDDRASLWPTGIPPWSPTQREDKANARELVSLLDRNGSKVDRTALAAICEAKDHK